MYVYRNAHIYVYTHIYIYILYIQPHHLYSKRALAASSSAASSGNASIAIDSADRPRPFCTYPSSPSSSSNSAVRSSRDDSISVCNALEPSASTAKKAACRTRGRKNSSTLRLPLKAAA